MATSVLKSKANSTASSSANIAVVGAGLIGRLIAWQLAKQGQQVTLFDRDQGNGEQSAAYAAGGLLAPLSEALKCEANMVAMGHDALKLWPQLLAQLTKPVFFQQNGTLIVTHQQDNGDFNHFSRYIADNYSNYSQQAVNYGALAKLEPELANKFQQGLFLPDEAQLDNRQLLQALATELKQLENVKWRDNSEVISLKPHSVELVTGNEQFELVVDCRGTGAKGQQTGQLSNLRAVRGELIHLHAPEVKLKRSIRLTHPRYQIYIAPKADNRYIIGATEIESDSLAPVTVRSSLELLSAAYSVHSGFAEANIIDQISQCRPAFSDNQPRINHQPGLVQVNGLFRHGFMLAPVILEHALAVINQDSSEQNIRYPELVSEHHVQSQQITAD
ncbi:glycine oxidase ThiO [Endozoicomonas sp. G2_1]|uniref:glycine oxidase ThiO n=1 Tax=Endozoicomonas sp. G2_1 TaxID=2821091 RepID=UPI001ADCD17B|nr:glycine oxidase ThiO [Endozoicomonas sp. G2_1]MBO9490356.1 glycine oxidase ThiO [Endozoicomonas sp. G2_1]